MTGPPGRVDQIRAPLHLPEGLPVKEVVGGVHKRDMDADVVSNGQQFFKRYYLRTAFSSSIGLSATSL